MGRPSVRFAASTAREVTVTSNFAINSAHTRRGNSCSTSLRTDGQSETASVVGPSVRRKSALSERRKEIFGRCGNGRNLRPPARSLRLLFLRWNFRVHKSRGRPEASRIPSLRVGLNFRLFRIGHDCHSKRRSPRPICLSHLLNECTLSPPIPISQLAAGRDEYALGRDGWRDPYREWNRA